MNFSLKYNHQKSDIVGQENLSKDDTWIWIKIETNNSLWIDPRSNCHIHRIKTPAKNCWRWDWKISWQYMELHKVKKDAIINGFESRISKLETHTRIEEEKSTYFVWCCTCFNNTGYLMLNALLGGTSAAARKKIYQQQKQKKRSPHSKSHFNKWLTSLRNTNCLSVFGIANNKSWNVKNGLTTSPKY